MPVISFVIPVYRNRGSIRETVTQIRRELTACRPTYGYEILFVDDGSDDGSREQIRLARREDPNVGLVALSRNFGQVAAMVEGLRRVRGDAVVLLSADLQDPIELIEAMIGRWERGDLVVVCHRSRRDDGLLAAATSAIFYRLMRISLPQLPPGGFDFVLLDRKPLEALNAMGGRNRFFQGDVMWLGFPVGLIPYERKVRPVGRSQWTLGKKVKYFLDGLLNTAYWPIRLMSLCGVLTALLGFLYAGVVVYLRLMEDVPFTGWAPIMVAILLIGGGIMAMLGVVGEYVWRIYDDVRGRPLTVVDEVLPPRDPAGGESRGAQSGVSSPQTESAQTRAHP